MPPEVRRIDGTHASDRVAFLRAMLGERPSPEAVVRVAVNTPPASGTGKGTWSEAAFPSVEAAAPYLSSQGETAETYASLAWFAPGAGRKAELVIARRWVSVDVDDKAMPGTTPEERHRQARALADQVPVPRVLVESGGGYHVHLLAPEGDRVEGPSKPADGRLAFSVLGRALRLFLEAQARELFGRPVRLDHCHGPERVWRLPPGFNAKNPTEPKALTADRSTWRQVRLVLPSRSQSIADMASGDFSFLAPLISAAWDEEEGTRTTTQGASVDGAAPLAEFDPAMLPVELRDGWPHDGGDRSGIDFKIAVALFKAGHGESVVQAAIRSRRALLANAADRAKGTREDYLARTVAKARARVPRDRLPKAGSICLDPGRYVLVDLAKGLKEKGEPLYRRSGHIVRPVVVDESGPDEVGVRREAGSLVIREVTPIWLAAEARRVLSFCRTKSDGSIASVDLPRDRAAELLETESAWPWPVLRGVTGVPVFLPDGRVLSVPGFDRESGLLYRPPAGLVLPPVGTTREEAEEALARIARLFSEFPWCPRDGTPPRESPSHSVALSAVLSGFVARSIPAVPLHAFDAPDSRVGKSLAATVVGLILTGLPLPAMAYDGEGEEGWKRLASVLLSGDPAVLLDNVETPLTGPVLCSMISESATSIRMFGRLENVVVPSNVLPLATGINLRARNDMVKRVVKGRMDAEREDPEARTFALDPRAEVLARRGEYVRDVLTVLRAHALAGFPGDPKASDFSEWSRLVRGSLLWLGYADPVETQKDLAAGDPDREAMLEVCYAWEGFFGGEAIHRTLAEVFRELEPPPPTRDGEHPRRTPEQDRLYRALLVLGGGKENPRMIGKRFAEWEGRRAEGFVLERGGEKRDGLRWTVRRT